MAHINRHNIGKFWPIPRKGSKYLARSSHNLGQSIPLVIVMREVLGLVKTKKELQKLINEKQIQINGKEIRETNYPICLFDILTLTTVKKNYKATLSENKKFAFEEVKDKDAKSREYKVLGKKILSKDKIQLNLMTGKNITTKEKAKMADTIILGFDNKIIEIIELKKGNNAMVLEGKHTGKKGKIDEVVERGGKKLVKITSEKDKINVWIKNTIAIK